MSQKDNSRRDFLKSAAKTTVVATAVGAGVVGCGGNKVTDNLTRGESTKEEIIYQRSPQWNLYYSKC
ncbi:MAG: hypothetical protein ACTTJS_08495 [Wolinella sp.]